MYTLCRTVIASFIIPNKCLFKEICVIRILDAHIYVDAANLIIKRVLGTIHSLFLL